MERVSRINFMFFTRTGLFQVSMNQISFIYIYRCTVHISVNQCLWFSIAHSHLSKALCKGMKNNVILTIVIDISVTSTLDH